MDSTATAPGRKSAAGTPVQVSRGTPSAAAEIVVMRRDVTDCGSCRICGREERVHKLLGNAKNVFPQLPQSFLMHSPAPRECVMPRVQGVSRSRPTRPPGPVAATRTVGKLFESQLHVTLGNLTRVNVASRASAGVTSGRRSEIPAVVAGAFAGARNSQTEAPGRPARPCQSPP